MRRSVYRVRAVGTSRKLQTAVELVIEDAQGRQTADVRLSAPVELQVEGQATIWPLRVLDEWDNVRRFTPEAITVDGPIPEQAFSMYETEDHIVEGFVTDEFGDPVDIDEVMIKYGTGNGDGDHG